MGVRGPKTKINLELFKQQYLVDRLTLGEIAESQKCSKGYVTYLAQKNNWVREKVNGLRKTTVNHDYFETWSANMAYILGFITADGAVRDGHHYYLRVELNPKDKKVVEFIRDEIHPEGNLYHYEHIDKRHNKINYSISTIISSPKLVKSLRKYGIVPNKTGNHKLDFDIPKEYVRDYVRGFFDGDGCIYVNKEQNRYGVNIVCKSLDFLESFRKLIGISGGYIINQNTLPTLLYSKSNSIILRNLMYYNECFCLQRKRDKFNQLA